MERVIFILHYLRPNRIVGKNQMIYEKKFYFITYGVGVCGGGREYQILILYDWGGGGLRMAQNMMKY